MPAFVQQFNTIKKQCSNSPIVFLILILLHHHVASNPKKVFKGHKKQLNVVFYTPTQVYFGIVCCMCICECVYTYAYIQTYILCFLNYEKLKVFKNLGLDSVAVHFKILHKATSSSSLLKALTYIRE